MFLAAFLMFLAAAQPAQPAAIPFERFFTGLTEGKGTATVMLSGRRNVSDRTRGRIDASGALLLDQLVSEEGKPARHRTWRLVRAGGNRFSGTISDAKGAVTGDVAGATLHLAYRLAEGPTVEQWITLHSAGRAASNRMVFHRFGMKVATVETVIRKVQ